MASPFNYLLSVTGDCQSQGIGAITIIALDGTPPYTYEWTYPNLPPAEEAETDPSTKTGLYPGTYVIRISDSTLPENESFYVNATVSSGLTAVITGVSGTTCGTDNGSVTVSANTFSSSVLFQLCTSAGTVLNSFDSNTGVAQFSNLSAGTYNIKAIDIGGCTGQTSDFIVVNSNPLSFGLYLVPNSACSTVNDPIGKIYVTGQTGTPPYTYVWSNNMTGSTITGLTNGYYSVTVTDANGCTAYQNAELTNVNPLGFVYFSASTPSCFSNDGSLEMVISGGTAPYYYSATTGAVGITYSQNFTINNLGAGTYGVVVTDAGLCQIFAATTLSTPESIGSIGIKATNSTCSQSDASIEINVGQGVPPFTYTLVYPDSSNVSFSSLLPNYLFPNLSAGTYTVFVEDPNGCTFSQSVTLFTTNLFLLSTSTTGTTCNLANGSVSIELTPGGTAPFTYSVDGVDVLQDSNLTAFTISNLFGGSHLVSVTDANGCTQSKTIFINDTPSVNFALFSTNCGTGSQGSLTAFISSGTPPYKFYWSDNVPGNPQSIVVSNLSADTYSLTIVDSVGCSLNRTATIACTPLNSGYYPFEVASEVLTVVVESDMGILQMLNDGFQDLTEGNENCKLNSAIYTAVVTVSPVGLVLQNSFYTGNSLVDVPSSNLWFNAIENLLVTVPGVESVDINPLTNQISITKSPTNNYLNGQIVDITLSIEYDISC